MSVKTFAGIFWEKNIYFSRNITGPSNSLDCLNECLNVQVGICQMFAFQNGICYLGRADKTDGTVAEQLTNVIVYSVSSKFNNYTCRIIVRIEFPPVVEISVNRGHYFPQ